MKDLIAALAGIAVLFILYAIHPILGGIGGFFFLIIWAFFKGFMDRNGAQNQKQIKKQTRLVLVMR
jgi:gamma-glutamyltranspeptidase